VCPVHDIDGGGDDGGGGVRPWDVLGPVVGSILVGLAGATVSQIFPRLFAASECALARFCSTQKVQNWFRVGVFAQKVDIVGRAALLRRLLCLWTMSPVRSNLQAESLPGSSEEESVEGGREHGTLSPIMP
jgi:hypothetical protein